MPQQPELKRSPLAAAPQAAFSMADYLQLSCMAGRSVTLVAHQDVNRLGEVTVFGGDVWHAVDALGTGAGALKRLSLLQASVHVEPLVTEPGPRSVFDPWDKLLMDAALEADAEGWGLELATSNRSGIAPRGNQQAQWETHDMGLVNERADSPPATLGADTQDALADAAVPGESYAPTWPPPAPEPGNTQTRPASMPLELTRTSPASDDPGPLVPFVPNRPSSLARLAASLVPEPPQLRRRRQRTLWGAIIAGVAILLALVVTLGDRSPATAPNTVSWPPAATQRAAPDVPESRRPR